MIKEYHVHYMKDLSRVAEDPMGALFSLPAGLEDADIGYYMQTPESFRVRCGCRMGWNETGLYIWEYAMETELRMEEVGTCSRAWEDSCLEVFMAPNPDRPDYYFNYECTPAPYVYLSKGTGRNDRVEFRVLPEGMEPVSSILPGQGWSIRYRVTPDFMQKEFGAEPLKKGMVLHANFQKCGNKTVIPHWALWNPSEPLEDGRLDFHQPKYFGRLILD
ncbi:MAG: carbohydrate-binding family 9-like protein [Clostridia bacterium]|nr:carbohydrate-binding family 9-like protein [Clostridia bacterium]